MPRVRTKTKSRAGQKYHCGKCGKAIKPKEKYYEWKFRYGGTHRQHESCGYPRASQLTQSKMSTVYAAIEDAGDDIAKAETPSDIADALDNCAESAREVASEYEQAMEAMGEAGANNSDWEERKSALEDFADSLDNAASEMRDHEVDDDDAEAEEPDMEALRTDADNALSELTV